MLNPEKIKEVLMECTGLEAEITENTVKVIPSLSGYLTPVSSIEIAGDNLFVHSSPITNTEWWQAVMPTSLCPRFMGIMDIKDDFTQSCAGGKCEEACQAEDDFVELRASRLRLKDDEEIISKRFPRLHLFLARTRRLLEETNSTYNTNIELDVDSCFPFLCASVASDEEALRSTLEAFKSIYPEITGVRGKVDTAEIPPTDLDFDPMDEESLVDEARYYALVEMVRCESKDLLAKLMSNKGGTIEEKYYVIEAEKLRYILYPNRIEAYRNDNELYMGTVYFNKGINEVKNYLVTILGGGRW